MDTDLELDCTNVQTVASICAVDVKRYRKLLYVSKQAHNQVIC